MQTETTFTAGGTKHTISRLDVQAASARLVPVHSEHMPNNSWYVLVGTDLHTPVDLVNHASGSKLDDVEPARRILHDLGFPLFCLAWGKLLKGHPEHADY